MIKIDLKRFLFDISYPYMWRHVWFGHYITGGYGERHWSGGGPSQWHERIYPCRRFGYPYPIWYLKLWGIVYEIDDD